MQVSIDIFLKIIFKTFRLYKQADNAASDSRRLSLGYKGINKSMCTEYVQRFQHSYPQNFVPENCVLVSSPPYESKENVGVEEDE